MNGCEHRTTNVHDHNPRVPEQSKNVSKHVVRFYHLLSAAVAASEATRRRPAPVVSSTPNTPVVEAPPACFFASWWPLVSFVTVPADTGADVTTKTLSRPLRCATIISLNSVKSPTAVRMSITSPTTSSAAVSGRKAFGRESRKRLHARPQDRCKKTIVLWFHVGELQYRSLVISSYLFSPPLLQCLHHRLAQGIPLFPDGSSDRSGSPPPPTPPFHVASFLPVLSSKRYFPTRKARVGWCTWSLGHHLHKRLHLEARDSPSEPFVEVSLCGSRFTGGCARWFAYRETWKLA